MEKLRNLQWVRSPHLDRAEHDDRTEFCRKAVGLFALLVQILTDPLNRASAFGHAPNIGVDVACFTSKSRG